MIKAILLHTWADREKRALIVTESNETSRPSFALKKNDVEGKAIFANACEDANCRSQSRSGYWLNRPRNIERRAARLASMRHV